MSGDAGLDRAWVRLATPLAPDALRQFVGADIERLLRVSSRLDIRAWERLGPDHFRWVGRNLSTGQAIDTEVTVTPTDDGVTLAYGALLKAETSYRVAPAEGGGSVLTVTDDYSGRAETEKKERAGEIDTGLTRYGEDLHRFLARWHRWGGNRLWRWWTERIWLRLTPSGRRIVYMILVVTTVEIAALLLMAMALAFDLDRRLFSFAPR
jgi:hypothetical protein